MLCSRSKRAPAARQSRAGTRRWMSVTRATLLTSHDLQPQAHPVTRTSCALLRATDKVKACAAPWPTRATNENYNAIPAIGHPGRNLRPTLHVRVAADWDEQRHIRRQAPMQAPDEVQHHLRLGGRRVHIDDCLARVGHHLRRAGQREQVVSSAGKQAGWLEAPKWGTAVSKLAAGTG